MQSCDVTKENNFHVLIVGGGPAAVSAAIYCHRFDLKTIMIGQEYGGAIARTYLLENYPGFPEISGYDLMEEFQKHYEHFKIPFEYETITAIEKMESGIFTVTDSGGTQYQADCVIVTTGTRHRKLDIPGEDDFHGRGESYCGTCDGPFFRDKKIIVVGGSDSAAVEALFLSRFGKKVSIVYRREKIRSEPINTARVEANEKIEIINNTKIVKINGTQNVESVEFDDGTIFPVDGVFIEIGAIPQSDIVKDLGVILNKKGEIVVDKFAQTNIPGLFAAGDVTDIREKQMIIACGQAVTASHSVREYLEND
jgi:thioredoxin reductase (NADPH)